MRRGAAQGLVHFKEDEEREKVRDDDDKKDKKKEDVEGEMEEED